MLEGRKIYSEEHELFRKQARRFLFEEFEPKVDGWELEGRIPRSFWRQFADLGFVCCDIDETYGGPGGDLHHSFVVFEEIGYAIGGTSLTVSTHAGVVAPYIAKYGSEEQRKEYLPRMVSAEWIGAIGMTEPSMGSDLRALRTTAKVAGDDYVINGQKTFISNGQSCDFVLLAVKTGSCRSRDGISLILVETDRVGFRRGRTLKKIGQRAADTSEMYFEDVRVPRSNLLGPEGEGLNLMKSELARERVGIACRCFAAAVRAFELTIDYVKQRQAFGRAVLDFQNTRFSLGNIKAELLVGRAFLDECISKLARDALSAEDAAAAKLWLTELEGRVVDQCLQFFGGYGYMSEYPISKFYLNARATRLYGGTSEIMKEILGRSL